MALDFSTKQMENITASGTTNFASSTFNRHTMRLGQASMIVRRRRRNTRQQCHSDLTADIDDLNDVEKS